MHAPSWQSFTRTAPAAAGWVLSHDALRLDLQDLSRLLDALVAQVGQRSVMLLHSRPRSRGELT